MLRTVMTHPVNILSLRWFVRLILRLKSCYYTKNRDDSTTFTDLWKG